MGIETGSAVHGKFTAIHASADGWRILGSGCQRKRPTGKEVTTSKSKNSSPEVEMDVEVAPTSGGGGGGTCKKRGGAIILYREC